MISYPAYGKRPHRQLELSNESWAQYNVGQETIHQVLLRIYPFRKPIPWVLMNPIFHWRMNSNSGSFTTSGSLNSASEDIWILGCTAACSWIIILFRFTHSPFELSVFQTLLLQLLVWLRPNALFLYINLFNANISCIYNFIQLQFHTQKTTQKPVSLWQLLLHIGCC